MKNVFKLAVLACVGLSSTAFADDDVVVNPNNQARVRFFGQAVLGLEFYRNNTCFGGDSETASSTGFGGAFGSKKNIELGIPHTPNVANLKERNGILAKAFYREYAVTAGEPMAIEASYAEATGGGLWGKKQGLSGCKGFGGSFVPVKGADYEVTLDVGGSSCKLVVSKIDVAKNTTVVLSPVALKPASECKD
jgi:hypothetical protein